MRRIAKSSIGVVGTLYVYACSKEERRNRAASRSASETPPPPPPPLPVADAEPAALQEPVPETVSVVDPAAAVAVVADDDGAPSSLLVLLCIGGAVTAYSKRKEIAALWNRCVSYFTQDAKTGQTRRSISDAPGPVSAARARATLLANRSLDWCRRLCASERRAILDVLRVAFVGTTAKAVLVTVNTDDSSARLQAATGLAAAFVCRRHIDRALEFEFLPPGVRGALALNSEWCTIDTISERFGDLRLRLAAAIDEFRSSGSDCDDRWSAASPRSALAVSHEPVDESKPTLWMCRVVDSGCTRLRVTPSKDVATGAVMEGDVLHVLALETTDDGEFQLVRSDDYSKEGWIRGRYVEMVS
eukprot:TRINITY_DN9105_c0_g1_i1.p1 TRINITY_DN9105_c0_g1~~TRINITY_DN9105_c0_g1_i1.p1  ORF type:complete len:359 (+),score=45.24 TRINITY_DN9105_c0_g1_i1:85-1161(+)